MKNTKTAETENAKITITKSGNCALREGAEIVEEASLGRPTYYDKPMTQTAIWLPDEMIEWLKEQPGGMGENIRCLIKQAMEDKMNEKLIRYDDFVNWHTANGTDSVNDATLKAAYEIYKKLLADGGKEYADDKICGHPVWSK